MSVPICTLLTVPIRTYIYPGFAWSTGIVNYLDPLLNPRKLARLLGVEVETLSAWRRKGYGPRCYRIGRKIKYSEADLRTWMSAQVLPPDRGRPAGGPQ